MSRVSNAVQQIRIARLYVEQLIKDLEDVDWFTQPSEGVTHVAWQIGHLATAQYRLALERCRGEQPADADLIPDDFRKRFGKGSIPDPNPANNPSCEEIREVFKRVHQQALTELADLSDEKADEEVPPPTHPMFRTRLEALQWCSNHEFIHAGQIGLLRRLLGRTAIR